MCWRIPRYAFWGVSARCLQWREVRWGVLRCFGLAFLMISGVLRCSEVCFLRCFGLAFANVWNVLRCFGLAFAMVWSVLRCFGLAFVMIWGVLRCSDVFLKCFEVLRVVRFHLFSLHFLIFEVCHPVWALCTGCSCAKRVQVRRRHAPRRTRAPM